MADKLYEYQGPIGRLHALRDNARSNYAEWKENHSNFDKKLVDSILRRKTTPGEADEDVNFDFSHIHRRKTRWELLRLCAVVAGIEFSYSAITAFSSPILLEMGVHQNYMSMVFSLSPLLGFFLSPICGSLSDRCALPYGRRRVFIVVFSVLELLGLFLIPFGHSWVNDQKPYQTTSNASWLLSSDSQNFTNDGIRTELNTTTPIEKRYEEPRETGPIPAWVIIVTILGIVIADHFADNLQNPSRAYLLDVCDEADHTRGLSTFTVLAGCGGFIGYGLGSIDWDSSSIGDFFGGHIKTVFRLTSFLFTICVLVTITAFKEVPLNLLHKMEQNSKESYCRRSILEEDTENIKLEHLDGKEENEEDQNGGNCGEAARKMSLENNYPVLESSNAEAAPSLQQYLSSIVNLPYSLKILLLTNVLCWMSHVSYSLYFTDYVGEAVYGGDPKASVDSLSRKVYEEGVRFACQGMSIYSLSCMFCSLLMERVIEKFGVRKVYAINIAIDILSMALMYYFNSKEGAIIFSFASGILYCTIFTIPYLIVARYHTLNVFEVNPNGDFIYSTQVRGLGTDIAIIGSSVFIAQFFLSLGMGFITTWYGSTRAVPLMCCLLSCGAFLGTMKVVYLDL